MAGLTFSCIPYEDQKKVYFLGIMLVMAAAGNVEMVELFLKNNSNINEEDRKGRTALHWAILTRHEAVTRMLLKEGANPTHADKKGVTPIMLQVAVHRSQSILNMLIESAQKPGNDIFGANHEGETALHVAAKHGNIDAMQLFLDLGADASKKDCLGYYPLLRAIKSMPLSLTRPIFQAMVEAFGEVSTPNSLGQTPLHFAVEFSLGWLVDLLLAAGADMTFRNMDSQTPVCLAVLQKGSCGILSSLIRHGANPYYTQESCGQSPIEIIFRTSPSWVTSRLRLPPYLIRRGLWRVKCKILRIISRAPVVEVEHDKFVSSHLRSCYRELHLHGRSQCGSHRTDFALALHTLCLIPTKPRTIDTTERLIHGIISSNASFLAKDTHGFTPLHYAAQSGKKKVMQLFLEYGHNDYCTKYSGVKHTLSRFNDVVEGLLIAGRAEDALIRDEDGVCGIDRWAMSSIHDHLSFVVVNRLLARTRILACLGDCDETYFLRWRLYPERYES
ncbi:hypothetical protein EMPG_10396 [Blastomyces silverae]|uniref:Uncharacterized protein n=1 Tax=Blastomyces silverae TaxID=2060906 RepID=A0A0H1B522_9EURO|nr:hypothetical protein EMPG_10396 [Blastomyces silverae]